MNKQYHILNGDALRECLVDGYLDRNSLEEFFATRAEFINERCGAQTHKK